MVPGPVVIALAGLFIGPELFDYPSMTKAVVLYGLMGVFIIWGLRSMEFHSRSFEFDEAGIIQRRWLGTRRIEFERGPERLESYGLRRTIVELRVGPTSIRFSSHIHRFKDLYAKLNASTAPAGPGPSFPMHLRTRPLYWLLVACMALVGLPIVFFGPIIYVIEALSLALDSPGADSATSISRGLELIELVWLNLVFIIPAAIWFLLHLRRLARDPAEWRFDSNRISFRLPRKTMRAVALSELREVRVQGPARGGRALVVDLGEAGYFRIGAVRAACFGTSPERLALDLERLYGDHIPETSL